MKRCEADEALAGGAVMQREEGRKAEGGGSFEGDMKGEGREIREIRKGRVVRNKEGAGMGGGGNGRDSKSERDLR